MFKKKTKRDLRRQTYADKHKDYTRERERERERVREREREGGGEG